MNADLQNLKQQYSKLCENFNKNNINVHNIVAENYDILCMNFYSDKYNINVAQNLAEEFCFAQNQSEDVFVNWLNKE